MYTASAMVAPSAMSVFQIDAVLVNDESNKEVSLQIAGELVDVNP
jgi:hypothetical protein